MSIAISAIVLVMLLIPGTAAISSYYGSFTNKASSVYIPFNDLLTKGLIISAFVHCFALCLLNVFGFHVDMKFLYEIVAGNTITIRDNIFEKYCKQFITYSLIVSMATYFASKGIKKLIQDRNYDLIFYALRTTSYWYNMFGARHLEEPGVPGTTTEVDFVFLDILTKEHFLYSGRLLDFNYSPIKDELENIVLGNAIKRKIKGDEVEPHDLKLTDKKFVNGDSFVINASTILNINISYIDFGDFGNGGRTGENYINY